MLKLALLLLSTLAAILVVLSTFGSENRVAEPPEPIAEDSATEGGESPGMLANLAREPESNGADGEPPADLVQVAQQTPQKVQDFPGPSLRPSPEHADDTTDANAQLQSAEGPILYVTGIKVNFRAGPSTGDRVIGALDQGMAVEALGPADGEWVNIRDTNGRIGYMSGQFLSPDLP